MSEKGPEIRLYSDYVCPFCYLGRESLGQYLDQRGKPLSVDWQPFDLRGHKRGPDGELDRSIEDGKDEAYFEQVRENVKRLKNRYGADEMLGLEELPEVDSHDAQCLSLWVKREHPTRWPSVDRAIFDALWVEGRDIGATDVLVDIARSAGIPEAEARAALEDANLRGTLSEAFAEAREQGITGVPTFIYDDHAARGAVPPEQLERLVEGEVSG